MIALPFPFRNALRLARREIRGGFSGFYIFLACVALGTGAIAAVNSVSQAINGAIAAQGQAILAGDLRFELRNREASKQERAYLDSLGTVAVSTGLRSMARLEDGSAQALTEVKAVDGAYPLYGSFEASLARPLAALLAKQGDAYGAVAAPMLLQRLGISIGDDLLLGKARLKITATIVNEPDALSDGFGFAPRLITGQDAIAASGLVQTGSLVEHVYKIRLADPAAPRRSIAAANAAFPDAGWSVRDRDRATPSLSENIGRFSQFLTLVGLTALIVGGVGVANAVRAFLDSRRTTIAALKCLGAPAATITMTYLLQIAFIAAVGIGIGLIIGLAAPFLAMHFLKSVLPVPEGFVLYPGALGLAALFGLLTTLAFAVLPLGQAREVPATALFREQAFEEGRLPSWPYLFATAALFTCLAGLAVVFAEDRFIASIFLAAVAFAFVILRLVAAGIKMLAKAFSGKVEPGFPKENAAKRSRHSLRVHSPALRLAIGNIHRPGALTPSVVLSLGLGLTLIVTLGLIDGNLRRELTGDLPARAPNFFFVDIQGSELQGFRDLIKDKAPQGVLSEVPMLRGRILALNGRAVSEQSVPPAARWLLRGDRGITYARDLPANTTLTEGRWWGAENSGEPLVSFAAKEAGELGLKLGDSVTVNVLGRNITARITNFRNVEWRSLSMNFVMVFSPESFRGAPHAWLATLADPAATAEEEGKILKRVTNAYPTVTSIRVKDALEAVNALVGQLAIAIRAAAAVALVASVLVLAGALAAGNRARTHDAVILKTLGGTRALLIRAFAYEYLLLGLTTAVFALLAGGIAAWFVTARIMALPSRFLPDVAASTLVIALIVTVGIGLLGTWRILGQRVAPVLRQAGE